jgi:hypothetical protein
MTGILPINFRRMKEIKMAQSVTRSPMVDTAREVRTDVRNRTLINEQHSTFLPTPTVSAPELAMPDYVEHRDGATEIGRLSAEAVVREYEATAKEIESMGKELIEQARQCEAVTRETLAVTAELNEVAARYRQEAKRVFEQIEGYSLVVAEARKACSELKDKIIVAVGTDGPKQKRT